ncbi:ribulose-5-phosphate-3-epimerase [Holotrichia oblita]|nr:ribulose-5-phosphate-3-epimerase [Holotrichia oblita]
MYKLASSILSADFNILGEQIEQIEAAGADYIHFDVMDGHFVPNISFGIPVLKSIRANTNLIFDVHLMIASPEKYIKAFSDAGADIINFHYEAAKNPLKLIQEIKSLGKKCAMTIKPGTDVENIYKYLNELDMVLLMSVEPGFGGQMLIESTLEKARKLRDYITQKNLVIDIEMDGGIYPDNLGMVLDAGVNVVVAGAAIFENNKINTNIDMFMRTFKEREVTE